VASGGLHCGGEAAVQEQPRDPGGHGGVTRILGGGVEEAERRKRTVRMASRLYSDAPRRRGGLEYLLFAPPKLVSVQHIITRRLERLQ